MRGIAMSDLHLDFKAGTATIDGLNVRQMDVERAWRHAVDLTIAAQPDLITIAGDVFDHAISATIIRAVRAFQDGLRRILLETSAYVVVIPGNHEGTRTIEALTPVALIDGISDRVIVVTDVERIRLNIARTGESVAIACYPFGELNERSESSPDPDPTADVNVLLIHAAVRSCTADVPIPGFYAGEDKVDVGPLAESYDVIVAGDFHQYRRLHPSRIALYSGSIEHTSSDFWKDADVPKGIVSYDTATGEMHQLVIPTRRVIDVAWSDLADYEPTAKGLWNALTMLLEDPDTEGSIVRLVVEDFPREERAIIDRGIIHRMQRHCLQFRLDLRLRADDVAEMADAREQVTSSVTGQAETFFAEDPEDVRVCCIGYLSAAAGES